MGSNEFGIKFTSSSLNNVGGASSVNSNPIEKDVKVFNANVSNPIANQPAYTEADFAEMWFEAGVKRIDEQDAPEAAAATKAFAVMGTAGFDIEALDELFAKEQEVVYYTLTAFQDDTASRIARQNQTVATLIENLPEGTTKKEFDALLYTIYS